MEYDKELINSIKAIVDLDEQMKGAFFWQPPILQFMKKIYNKKHSLPEVKWTEDGHTFTASYTTDCGPRHIFAEGHYTCDGRKVEVQAIKNSLDRMTFHNKKTLSDVKSSAREKREDAGNTPVKSFAR